MRGSTKNRYDRTPTRSGRTPQGARRRTTRRDNLLGRLGRGVLVAVLLLVVLLIAASYLGVFGRRDAPDEYDASGGRTLVYQDLMVRPDDDAGSRDGVGRGELWRPLRPVPVAEQHAGASGAGERAVSDGAVPDPGDVPEPTDGPIRVYLANGCGVNRLAAGMRDRFRQAGFDVCGISDADRKDYRETLVIDRSGERRRSEAVCAFLQKGWGVGRMILQTRSSPVADVLVVLGTDLVAAQQAGAQ